jgi:two-component system, OmpR family, sensor histidine kinase TctE
MPWRRVRRLTLRQGLLVLLVPTMVGVSAIELVNTYRYSAEAANTAYDRSLLGVIKAIDANVSTATGGLAVELPYRLFELFELTASGSVHFRVATADGLVEIGSPDLPPPPAPLTLGKAVFYDAEYFGDSVRVGAYMRELDRPLSASGAQHLLIQVSESTRSREEFTRRFLQSTATRDAVFLITMFLAVITIVSLVLRPVSRLASQVRGRQVADLTPLQARDLPADVQPLVDAVNQQIARTRDLVAQQRLFLDDASHQLRTPLATLRTQTDAVLRQHDPQLVRQGLEEISGQLDYATRSTNQLLVLARTDTAAIQASAFDLVALVRDTVVVLLPLARAKKQDLGIENSDENLPARGDVGLLREAISNLVENAVRYTQPGGEITVKAASERATLTVEVVDNGPGVAVDDLSRLGERFMRGRGRGAQSGSGLGLAIARSIAQRHGGTLVLESAPGARGFRAILRWPGGEAGT